jgi:hypothetical protein
VRACVRACVCVCVCVLMVASAHATMFFEKKSISSNSRPFT